MVIPKVDIGNEWERVDLGERIMNSFLDKVLGFFQLPKNKNPKTKKQKNGTLKNIARDGRFW